MARFQALKNVAPLMVIIGLGALLSACGGGSAATAQAATASTDRQATTVTPTAQTSAASVQQAATPAQTATQVTTAAPSTAMGMGRVALSWIPPTENTDGSSLGNLAGYRVYVGTSPSQMTQTVQISNPGLSAYVIENLSAGTTYFAITSYNSAGVESSLSGVASKTIS